MRFSGLVMAFAIVLGGTAQASLLQLAASEEQPTPMCTDVHFKPKQEQCAFIQKFCDPEEYNVGIIHHLSIYYCWSDMWKPLGSLLSALVLGLLFLGLGLTASDYLCPNLYSISKLLHMSDNLAGLTLLALGNSAPDVLSTYRAMSLGSGSLALSELLGAAFFINSVIIGSVAVISPIEVKRNLFVRDSAMFLLVSLVMLYIVFLSRITISSCIILLSLYVLYVLVVIMSHSVVRKRVRKHLEQVRSRSRFSRDSYDSHIQGIDQVYLDEFVNLPTIDTMVVVNSPEEENEIEEEEEEESEMEAEDQNLNEFLDSESNNLRRPLLPKTRSSEASNHGAIRLESESDLLANTRDYIEDDDDYVEPFAEFERRRSVFSLSKSHVRLLFPETTGFNELDVFSKMLFIASYPISIFLRLSTPSRDYTVTEFLTQQYKKNRRMLEFPDESRTPFELDDFDLDFTFDKKLLTVQTFFGTASAFGLLVGFETFKWYLSYPLVIIISTASAYGVSFNYMTEPNDYRFISKLIWINKYCTALGFVVSISWISFFATEVIAVLKTISVVYDLSDEVLGVTVFALGNSIGDLVSNLTIAKSGSPLMAFGACFGGPLISMCSLGVSALIVLSSSDNTVYDFNVSPSLRLFCGFLVLNVCITISGILFNNWKLDKRIGAVLILNWVIASAICVLRETG